MRTKFILVTYLVFTLLIGCHNREENNNTSEAQLPASIVKEPGEKFNLIVLSPDAANRINLELVPLEMREVPAPPATKITTTATLKQVPYSAIIYGINGETWVYIQVRPLTFRREAVTIERIQGDAVLLSQGPPANTQIVAQGASELYGVENIGNIEP